MIVSVHMLAFQEGNLRPVVIPVDHKPNEPLPQSIPIREMLEMVFHYGQNDIQPCNGCCSVSMGDVAQIGDKFYLCCPVGWRELSEEEFQSYKNMDRLDRRYCKLMTENHLRG